MAPPSPASRARDMIKIVLIAVCAALSFGALWAVLELLWVI
ncbi:MAG: hypothetical protein ACTS3R_16775 [Inquilinaceae bacterium]